MRVTRIRRTRYLALAMPGDLRAGHRVRITAAHGDRLVHAENSARVSPGLVRLTVTEMSFRGFSDVAVPGGRRQSCGKCGVTWLGNPGSPCWSCGSFLAGHRSAGEA
jgi:ribosomal protein S27AE